MQTNLADQCIFIGGILRGEVEFLDRR